MWDHTAAERPCALCGATFTPEIARNGHAPKYCSPRCAQRGAKGDLYKGPHPARPCAICGASIAGGVRSGPPRKYCSVRCRERGGHPDSYAKPVRPRVCIGCGVEFTPESVRSAHQRYCSLPCARATRRTENRMERAEARPCAHCGALFSPLAPSSYEAKVPRHCSASCAAQAAAASKMRNARRVEQTCLGCATVFEAAWLGARTKRYCSNTCMQRAYYPPYVLKREDRWDPRACKECGGQVPPARRGPPGNYCSPSCRSIEGSRVRRARKTTTVVEKFTTAEIFARDGGACGLCKQQVEPRFKWPHLSSPSIDHVIPLSRGGTHTRANVQLAHLGCNLSKGIEMPA